MSPSLTPQEAAYVDAQARRGDITSRLEALAKKARQAVHSGGLPDPDDLEEAAELRLARTDVELWLANHPLPRPTVHRLVLTVEPGGEGAMIDAVHVALHDLAARGLITSWRWTDGR